MTAPPTTIKSARRWLYSQLQTPGVHDASSAAIDARVLLSHVIAVPPERLLTIDDRALTEAEVAGLRSVVQRRLAAEPVAHIVGVREFWGLPFCVNADVLVPRPDSETVVEAVLDRVPDTPKRILDCGTGSGCLLLSLLSERPAWTGLGIDISPAALAVAGRNAAALSLGDRAMFQVASFAALPTGPFDVVISNPPYIPTGDLAGLMGEVGHDPASALDGGADGLTAYRELIRTVPSQLAPAGLLVMEVGIGQARAVCDLAAGAGLLVEPPFADMAGIARCVVATRADETV